MNGKPYNPYSPPDYPRPRRRAAAHRLRWWEGGLRALAVILGFSLVADPTSLPGVETPAMRALGGYVLARTVGVTLLAAGFLPWQRRRSATDPAGEVTPPPEVEEL